MHGGLPARGGSDAVEAGRGWLIDSYEEYSKKFREAGASSTSAAVLGDLAEDPDQRIRQRVASNLGTPIRVILNSPVMGSW